MHCHVYKRQLVEPAVQPKQLSSVLCDDLVGREWGGREVQGGGYIYIPDSLCCLAETDTPL